MTDIKQPAVDMDKELDILKNELIKTPEFDNHRDEVFFRVIRGMEIRSLINQYNNQRQFMTNKLLAMLPMDLEDSKIIMARIADMTKEEIDNLTEESITEILTVDPEKGIAGLFTIPEVDDSSDFDMLEFKKSILSLFGATKEQMDDIAQMIGKLEEQYNEFVNDEAKEIIEADNFDEYTLQYYTECMNDESIEQEKREHAAKLAQAIQYVFTVEPIRESIIGQLTTKGNRSLLEGRRRHMTTMIETATKILEEHKVEFPFQLVMNLEETLFGSAYKEYNNLFVYIIARYVKFHKESLNHYVITFIHMLMVNLVTIMRNHETLPKEYLSKRLDSIKDLIDLVINSN